MAAERVPVISNDDSGLWVSIRSAPAEGKDTMLRFWLAGWAFGELIVTWTLLFGGNDMKWFLAIWLTGWTIGGAVVWYTYLWPRIGSTVLEIDDRTIRMRKVLGPIEFKKEFERARIMRVHGSSGSVAFECGGRKTYRFGDRLSPAESRPILDAIRARYPDILKEQVKVGRRGAAAKAGQNPASDRLR